MATNDFASQYAAYRSTDSLRTALGETLGYFGGCLTLAAASGLILALADPRARRLALLLVIQAGVAFATFNRTQSMGWQHEYLLLPALLFFVALALVRGLEKLAVPLARGVLASGMALALGAGFGALFWPAAETFAARAPWLFSSVRYRPLVRGDLPELGRLLRAIAAEVPPGGVPMVYVLASSTTLNDEVLRYAPLSDPALPDVGDRLLRTAHVDARDGFPAELFRAELVVLAEPTQLHLGPSFQRVVSVPAEQIRTGTGIGRSFARRSEEFRLDGGVRVRLYRRVLPPGEGDEAALRAALAAP
jgi:hypothetical protein